MKDKHFCPLCGRNQIYHYDTWLCPHCNSLEIDELSTIFRIMRSDGI